MKKQLAFVMVPALAVATVIGGSGQRDLISPASGGLRGGDALPTGPITYYDNSDNTLAFLVNGTDAEWGDGCTLAESGEVTSIILLIHSLAGGNATCDVTVRFFEGGDDPAANDPGAMLWQSDTFNRFPISPGLGPYTFEVPNILVPDSMTWTLELANCSTRAEIGSRFFSPPIIGTSERYLWNHNADGLWEAVTFDIGGPSSDLGSVIIGVSQCDPCDMNCDGDVDAFDIEPFLALLFEGAEPCDTCTGDVNGDGKIDAMDIEPFLECLFP